MNDPKIGVISYDACVKNISGGQTSGPVNLHKGFKEYLNIDAPLYSLVMSRDRHYEQDIISSKFIQLLPHEFEKLKELDFLVYSFLVPYSTTKQNVNKLTDKVLELNKPFALLINSEFDIIIDGCREILLRYLTDKNCKVLLTTGLQKEMVDYLIDVVADKNPECLSKIKKLDSMRLNPAPPKFNKMLVSKEEALRIKEDRIGLVARIHPHKQPNLLLNMSDYLNYPVELYGVVDDNKFLSHPNWNSVYKGTYSIESGHPSKYNWLHWAFLVVGKGDLRLSPRYELSAIESLQNACMPLVLTESMPSKIEYKNLEFPLNVKWDIMKRRTISIEEKSTIVNKELHKFMDLEPNERYDVCEALLDDIYQKTNLSGSYKSLYKRILSY